MISVLDLFSIGIGPSSSHTVGPMRAAARFVDSLSASDMLSTTARVVVDLLGSLGATGRGHGSDRAIVLGLIGERPESIDPATVDSLLHAIEASGTLVLDGRQPIMFTTDDVVLHRRTRQLQHPNTMVFTAFDLDGVVLLKETYWSLGGGFIARDGDPEPLATASRVPHPFASGDELVAICRAEGVAISEVMRRNERARTGGASLEHRLAEIWDAMQQCISRGISSTDALLPGGLDVRRRAPALHHSLLESPSNDELHAMEWVNLFAMAVNEENAAGGRVVTAPTNGAAGIIPAVLSYYSRFIPGADAAGVERFLLTAGAVGVLFKTNASIAGAEVGCQGEVGSACSMAAAGLAEVLGGTPEQVENAAEIAIEHNLGLTCDPVGGLVQIPCIERNAVAAMKAINAARMALRGDGSHRVSLDQAIQTMKETGADMLSKYKETSLGGLAVNVVEC